MSDMVQVAIISAVVTLINGPLLLNLIAKNARKRDEIRELRTDVGKLYKLVDRIAAGLTIGLKNDKVIFDALRKNSINGDSEQQERLMEQYFTECTVEGFKSSKGE
jgi:hypothetical protein